MKVDLNYDEAVSLLPDGDDIHTFKNAPFGLIGADWSREDILNKLKKLILPLNSQVNRQNL